MWGIINMPKEQAKYFWLGIPILFVAGSLFHFLYGLSGEVFAVGIFAPVNESIFEHTKLFPLPTIIWYGLIHLSHKEKINADPWYTAALLSIVTQISGMVLLYYFYLGAFGIKLLAVDITIFLVSVCIGQVTGLQYYLHSKGVNYCLSLSLIFAILFVYAILTIYPPHLPIFLDPITDTYGIYGLK